MLKDQMDRSMERNAATAATSAKKASKGASRGRGWGRGRGHGAVSRAKRIRVDSDEEEANEVAPPPSKRVKNDAAEESTQPAFVQPALLSGATLKSYQLEGVAWMVSLWENGISGILGM